MIINSHTCVSLGLISAIFSTFFVPFLLSTGTRWSSVLEAGGTILLRSNRKILAGEKIHISYGVHYGCDDRLKRQRFLQKRAIECHCVYCVTDTSDDHLVCDGTYRRTSDSLRFSFFSRVKIESKQCQQCGESMHTEDVSADICSDCNKLSTNDTRAMLLKRIDGIRERILKNECKKFCHMDERTSTHFVSRPFPADDKYATGEIITAELSILIGYEEIFGPKSIESLRQHMAVGSVFARNSETQAARWMRNRTHTHTNFNQCSSQILCACHSSTSPGPGCRWSRMGWWTKSRWRWRAIYRISWKCCSTISTVERCECEFQVSRLILNKTNFHLGCRINIEFTSLLANVLDFVAEVTESLHQIDGMPKLTCFYNRLVQLRKSFGECKAIATDTTVDAGTPIIRPITIPPIRSTAIHDDLNIFARNDSCNGCSSPSEKSF